MIRLSTFGLAVASVLGVGDASSAIVAAIHCTERHGQARRREFPEMMEITYLQCARQALGICRQRMGEGSLGDQ